MPVRKHANKKNAPPEVTHNPAVPRKEESSSKKKPEDNKLRPPAKNRVNALSTAGKKKKPK